MAYSDKRQTRVTKRRPTATRYLRRLLSRFRAEPLVLTEKVKESLLRALALARDMDSVPYANRLMYGLIAARSVAVPILDTADVDVQEYAARLRADRLGLADDDDDDFYCDPRVGRYLDSYNGLLSSGISEESIYTVMQFAGLIAKSSGQPAVDTSALFRALLRQSFDSELFQSHERRRQLANTPLANQIRRVLGQLHQRTGDHELERVDELTQNSGVDCLLQTFIVELFPYVRTLHDLDRLEHSVDFARNVEPYIESTKFALLQGPRRLHFRKFDYLNSYISTDEKVASACKINTVSGAGVLPWKTVHAFESLMNRNDVSEWDVQQFFVRHPQFLLGTQYNRLHSQVVLLRDDGTEMIPDFFAERLGTTFADIIELKRPSAKLVSGLSGRRGMASALTRALNQVREYRNYFDDPVMRRRFHQRYGFEAFRPAVTVVIGRSAAYIDYMERLRIEDEYKNLRILTYDDILQRAKRFAIHT